MKQIDLPSDAALVIVARAMPEGPKINLHVSEEWWAAANKDHRKALFIACLEALKDVGAKVIPEEFNGPT